MESKVRALTVAKLRDALTKSSTAFPPKANKDALIVKVLESPGALAALGLVEAKAPAAAAASPGDDNDDLLAPPAEFDWDGTANGEDKPAAAPTTAAPAKPASAVKPVPASASVKPTPAATPATATKLETPANPPDVPNPAESSVVADAEIEKRRKRAERFGVPFNELSAPSTPTPAGKPGKKGAAASPAVADDPDKLKARAARFGIATTTPSTTASSSPSATPKAPKAANGKPNPNPKKRPSETVATVDPEEEERRKKRAARFGAPTVTA
ncbi:hypothetical protein EXIGLDRAFT_840548 [Exidia glandulosa HHB12029]|uniref:THO1-MOS11 C-terminal domain-containing protein n=1 Tax=Exidia glandulosa HHB12029 TaxID=1314781 RepID=A0A165EE68_EXIGL|nr:hypothetical protein EXIGLDRAFT_840548 [Exidia glandulosa HHB12029]